MAVLLETPLQQDHERRLAARRWSEQEQQPSPYVGAGGCGLEVIDDALESAVDAEQLAGEQRRSRRFGVPRSPRDSRRVAIRAQHVVHVLMRRARQLGRIFGKDVVKEFGEGAAPVLCLMLRGEGGQV